MNVVNQKTKSMNTYDHDLILQTSYFTVDAFVSFTWRVSNIKQMITT